MGCCGHVHTLHSGHGGDEGEPRNDLKDAASVSFR
jgi:hypothetical protein